MLLFWCIDSMYEFWKSVCAGGGEWMERKWVILKGLVLTRPSSFPLRPQRTNLNVLSQKQKAAEYKFDCSNEYNFSP